MAMYRNPHRRVSLALAALMATFAGAAFAQSGAKCEAPSEIVFASWPVGVTLPVDVAQGIGAFAAVEKACHTKIKVVSFDAPQPMIAGTLSGQVHFAISNVQNQLLAAAQGQNLTGLISMAQGGNGIVVGKPSSKKTTGLQALKDYPENSIWAVTTLKGLSALVINAVNEKLGNDPAKARLVQTGGSAIPATVGNGKADLGYVPSPTAAAQAVSSGQVREIFNASGADVFDLIGFVPGWTMLASPDFVKKYPELAVQMTAAALKGLQFIRQNVKDPAKVYAIMPASYRSATSQAIWDRSWNWNASNYLVSGWIERSDLINTGKLMQKYGVLRSDYDLNTLPATAIAPDVLEAAFKSLGQPVPTTKVDSDLLHKIS
jgi:ABC-type nitrate/sulfonate/bicarbonate transport system substrate-binding protein